MNKQIMKRMLFSLGAMSAIAAPVATLVACTDEEKYVDPSGVDLTKGSKDAWHSLFHKGGRSLPSDNTGLKVTVEGKTYKYIWTAEDSKATTPAAFLAGAEQDTVVSYLANRFATAGIDAAKVYAAFGFPTANPHSLTASPVASVDMTGAPSTKAFEVKAAAQTQAPVTQNPVVQPVNTNTGTGANGGHTVTPATATHDLTAQVVSKDTWHSIFKDAQPKNGDIFKVTIASKEYTYVWDGSLSSKLGTDPHQEFVDALADKFVASDSTKTITRMQVEQAMGFSATPDHHGVVLPTTQGATTGGATNTVASTGKTYVLTSPSVSKDTWHNLVGAMGGTKLQHGDKLELTISNAKTEYVWGTDATADDAALKALTDGGAMPASSLQKAFVEYIANKLKGTHTLAEALTAMGFAAGAQHGHDSATIFNPAVSNTQGGGTTNAASAKTWSLKTTATGWHDLFRLNSDVHFNAHENDILQINDMSFSSAPQHIGRTFDHKLTAAEITILSAINDQNAAINAIMNLFIVDNKADESVIKAFFEKIAHAAPSAHAITIA